MKVLWRGELNGDTPALASYILSHLTNSGVWDVTVGGHTYHAAHHLQDYVKVYDVPSVA
jgi:hypothetical protein